nr:MAG TPA: Protein of unknown function (DUF551) [Caudoviricetes sp.]
MEWIKCSERMPDADCWVLICNVSLGGVDMGIYRNDEHLDEDEHWQNESGEFIEAFSGWPVTHWMPLPEPPSE